MQIPEGLKTSVWDKKISVKGDRVLLLSDIHAPYHDKKAIKTVIDFVKRERKAKRGFDTLYLNGDIVDCYRVSSHLKKIINPKTVKKEFKVAKIILDAIIHAVKPKHIYYKIGNHEDRWMNFFALNAPVLREFDFADFKYFIKNYLLPKRNVEIVESLQRATFGKLTLLHGHELMRGLAAPVNPARGLFLRGYSSSIMGHSHRTSHHSEKTIEDTTVGTWSVACLCELSPGYAVNNKWNHGFMVLQRRKGNGRFSVQNLSIIKDGNDMFIS